MHAQDAVYHAVCRAILAVIGAMIVHILAQYHVGKPKICVIIQRIRVRVAAFGRDPSVARYIGARCIHNGLHFGWVIISAVQAQVTHHILHCNFADFHVLALFIPKQSILRARHFQRRKLLMIRYTRIELKPGNYADCMLRRIFFPQHLDGDIFAEVDG